MSVFPGFSPSPYAYRGYAALLKLSEETDLDILNSCMETMVDRYQTELLPVAADLTARLVSCDIPSDRFI